MPIYILAGVGLLLALANGANDNFKGVATLFGAGATGYRGALVWATVTTGLGSVAALVLARGLIEAFRGNGLVPEIAVADPVFPAAVALAAGLTVLLATRVGAPISTTHALVGALVGAGIVVSPAGIDRAKLIHTFLLPLVASPLLAIGGTAGLHPLAQRLRRKSGMTRETCVCIGEEAVAMARAVEDVAALRVLPVPTFRIGNDATCRLADEGSFGGVRARRVLDTLHFASAGAVSFARGLNDTPKIAALLLVGGMLTPGTSLVGVGLAMALGGWIGARRVAETMAYRITTIEPGQGLVANAVTAGLVIAASRYGLPVSTTHVSCGALFGVGSVSGRARWSVIGAIVAAWGVTLPAAAGFGALLAGLLPRLPGMS